MKLYHVQTQEDYDALMEEFEEKDFLYNGHLSAEALDCFNVYKDKTVIKLVDDEFDFESYDFYKKEYPDVEITPYLSPFNKNIQAIEGPEKHRFIHPDLEVPDIVNNPPHYTTGQFEVIDILEDKLTAEQFKGFCKGNVIKYVLREEYKNGLEDLKKARWYLDKLIEQEGFNRS